MWFGGGSRKSMKVTLAETPTAGHRETDVATSRSLLDSQWRDKDTNLATKYTTKGFQPSIKILSLKLDPGLEPTSPQILLPLQLPMLELWIHMASPDILMCPRDSKQITNVCIASVFTYWTSVYLVAYFIQLFKVNIHVPLHYYCLKLEHDTSFIIVNKKE